MKTNLENLIFDMEALLELIKQGDYNIDDLESYIGDVRYESQKALDNIQQELLEEEEEE